MGMDVDYVFAKTALENIKDIVGKLPHGERKEICDEIIEFQDKICEKYGFPSAFKEPEPSTEEEPIDFMNAMHEIKEFHKKLAEYNDRLNKLRNK